MEARQPLDLRPDFLGAEEEAVTVFRRKDISRRLGAWNAHQQEARGPRQGTDGLTSLGLLKAQHTQATSRTKEVKLATTRRAESYELLWTSCCNRGMRFAAIRTAFTYEISERNTELIICNTFFCTIFRPRLFNARRLIGFL